MKKSGRFLLIAVSLLILFSGAGCSIINAVTDSVFKDAAVLEDETLVMDSAPVEDESGELVMGSAPAEDAEDGIYATPDRMDALQIDDGAVNTTSVLREAYYTVADYRCMTSQGNGIYYLYAGMIQRMPMGGKLEDIQRIFNASAEVGEPNNLQILGDWAYFTTRYDGGSLGGKTMYHQELYRVRTDGTQLECLADNMTYPHYYYGLSRLIEPLSTFVIQNDNLYYAQLTWNQIDASTADFTCSMIRLSLLDGSKTVLYAEPVESPAQTFGISSLSANYCILKWPGSEQISAYLWQIDSDRLSPAPEWITTESYLYADSDGSLLVYDFWEHILYYARPDHLDDPEIVREKFTYNDITISDGVIYFSDGTGLYQIKNREQIKINNDGGAQNLRYPGDGYLYYSMNINIYDSLLYRVHPDGSGWEQLGDWWN